MSITSPLLVKDLEWNTNRALDLLAAKCLSGWCVDIVDGHIDSNCGSDFEIFWEQYLDKNTAENLAAAIMQREILGGMSLLEYCNNIALAWSKENARNGRYTFNPNEGLIFSPDDEGGELHLVRNKSSHLDGLALYVEWSSEDWKYWGIVDSTEEFKYWDSEPGTLLEIIMDGLKDGYLEQDIDFNDALDKDASFEEMDKYRESHDLDMDYELSLINPHAIFPTVLLPSNKKMDGVHILTWMKNWTDKLVVDHNVDVSLINNFAKLAQRNTPPLSRQQRRAIARHKSKMN